MDRNQLSGILVGYELLAEVFAEAVIFEVVFGLFVCGLKQGLDS